MNLDERNRTLLSACSMVLRRAVLGIFVFLILMKGAWANAAEESEAFRILITKHVGMIYGKQLIATLEKLNYGPVYVEGSLELNKASIYLGNFTVREEAQKVKDTLKQSHISSREIINVNQPENFVSGIYTVNVATFSDQASAESAKLKMAVERFIGLTIREGFADSRFALTTAPFLDLKSAHDSAIRFREIFPSFEPAVVDLTNGKNVRYSYVTSGFHGGPFTLEQFSSFQWPHLTAAELSQIPVRIAKICYESDPNTKVAREIEKLTKRLRQLDPGAHEGITDVTPMSPERLEDANRRKKISELFRDSNNLARKGRSEEALALIREILEIDPEYEIAIQRETILIEFVYKTLKASVGPLTQSNTRSELIEARKTWNRIAALNARYEPEAKIEIAAINKRLKQLKKP